MSPTRKLDFSEEKFFGERKNSLRGKKLNFLYEQPQVQDKDDYSENSGINMNEENAISGLVSFGKKEEKVPTQKKRADYDNNSLAKVSHRKNDYIQHVKTIIPATKVTCTCTKTKCIKKYCACFAMGKLCEGCNCKCCENNPNFIRSCINGTESLENDNYNNISQNKLNNIICNCTKSYCEKKYCECFKLGIDCCNLCRCVQCQNHKGRRNTTVNINNQNSMNIDNEIINQNQMQKQNIININYANKQNQQKNLYEIEAIRTYVENNKLKIEKSKISLNNNDSINSTPKFSKRKRGRDKNDNSNLKTCANSSSVSNSRRKVKSYSQINKNIKTKPFDL